MTAFAAASRQRLETLPGDVDVVQMVRLDASLEWTAQAIDERSCIACIPKRATKHVHCVCVYVSLPPRSLSPDPPPPLPYKRYLVQKQPAAGRLACKVLARVLLGHGHDCAPVCDRSLRFYTPLHVGEAGVSTDGCEAKGEGKSRRSHLCSSCPRPSCLPPLQNAARETLGSVNAGPLVRCNTACHTYHPFARCAGNDS